MKDFLVSVVIPVYNEDSNIDPLLKDLLPVLKEYDYELIFVDASSTDHTVHNIKTHSKSNKNIKLLTFNRNFGHQLAITAGYREAKGNLVISMDADLQDPPSVIPKFIEKWQRGAKIVYGKRHSRDGEGAFKRLSAKLFYWFINFLSDTRIPAEVGDFRLLDREVVDFLNQLHEQSRFLRGLVAWGGYDAQYVYFDREKRHSGSTHYTLSKMFNFAIEGLTSFSTKPLRIAMYLGFISAFLGFLGIIYATSLRLLFPHEFWVTGWTALFVGIMFLGGVQLITIGIIGEYIGRIYKQIQDRPQYLIKERVNLDS